MADSEKNIPTLTDIAHKGNEDMLNHFDAHQFNDEAEESDSPFAIENASTLENTNTIENTGALENSELNEIPSIKIEMEDENNIDIETQDFSEAMQLTENKAAEKELDSNDLKEKIDQAIVDALPGIETHLKEQLYTKLGI